MEKSQIVLLAGMPRSGSTWILRLLNELWVTGYGQDYVKVREQYKIEKYMTLGSALVELRLPRVLPILYPLLRGVSFVAKTHSSPNAQWWRYGSRLLNHLLITTGRIRPIFLYRDPRDAVLSGYDYGNQGLQNNKINAFTNTFRTIEDGIDWMERYLQTCWLDWDNYPGILSIRYEDFLTNFTEETTRILTYLSLDSTSAGVAEALEKYRPGAEPQIGTHFFKAEIGRFRSGMTPQQIDLANGKFSAYLAKMGYSL